MQILKGHGTRTTSSPSVQVLKRWEFYTIRSVGISNGCVLIFYILIQPAFKEIWDTL